MRNGRLTDVPLPLMTSYSIIIFRRLWLSGSKVEHERMGFGLLSTFIVEEYYGQPAGRQNYPVAFRTIPVWYYFVRAHFAPSALESPMRTARYHILTAHRRKIL